SRLQRPSLRLPPGDRLQRTALLLNFRWHKMERRRLLEPGCVRVIVGTTLGRWDEWLSSGPSCGRSGSVDVLLRWERLGWRYTSPERRYVGLTLGSRLQRLALCLPPGERE